ncbi:mitochondrial acyl carrier protein 3 isoform X2 [Wolffia australiana]
MNQYASFILRHVRIGAVARDRWLFGVAARGMSGATGGDAAEVMNRVMELVKKYDRIDASKVTETADFQKDLGLDSLDRVELVMALEQEFSIDIPDETADKLACCSHVVQFLLSQSQNNSSSSSP